MQTCYKLCGIMGSVLEGEAGAWGAGHCCRSSEALGPMSSVCVVRGAKWAAL